MKKVTRILSAIDQGEPHAAEQLLPLVYDELRRLAAAQMAREKPGQTLDATALVHEAYLRLVGPADDRRWENRGHFFAAAELRPVCLLVCGAGAWGATAGVCLATPELGLSVGLVIALLASGVLGCGLPMFLACTAEPGD
jgi:hypothetical protein